MLEHLAETRGERAEGDQEGQAEKCLGRGPNTEASWTMEEPREKGHLPRVAWSPPTTDPYKSISEWCLCRGAVPAALLITITQKHPKAGRLPGTCSASS